jgi:hypothetical protein
MPASILTPNNVGIQHSPQIVTRIFPMALNYVSQTPKSISVTYSDMPAGANVVFVNQVSGAKTPSPGSALSAGGNGSAEIPVPDLAAGQYYLLAQNSGQYVAQTVMFYIN